MLVEHPAPGSSPSGFRVGDTVQVLTSRQTGRVVGFKNGLYEVSINGAVISVNGSNLERKEFLLG